MSQNHEESGPSSSKKELEGSILSFKYNNIIFQLPEPTFDTILSKVVTKYMSDFKHHRPTKFKTLAKSYKLRYKRLLKQFQFLEIILLDLKEQLKHDEFYQPKKNLIGLLHSSSYENITEEILNK